VGKSSLLNCIARRRISIVEPTAGVTRDRVSAVCDIKGRYYELVDTGGYGVEDCDNLTEHVEHQIAVATDRASLILFIVDVREGVTPLDRNVAQMLRRMSDRVVLVANKCDEPRQEAYAPELASLGYGTPYCISAQHGFGRSDLIDLIHEKIEQELGAAPTDPHIKVAVVGKRNTGKSTFINALAGEERVIVSEVAGTTRDAVDVRFEIDNLTFLAIDTAGVHKKAKLANDIEYYGYTRATRSIRRADVVLFFIDSTAPVSQVDKKLAHMITAEFKPCVLVVNKWDLAKDRASSDDYGEYLTKTLPQLDYAPVVFTSARDARNVQSVIDVAGSIFKQANTRVGTGQLNAALQQATQQRLPSAKRGRKLPRIFYATQVSVAPPTIVLFVNNPSLIDQNYERFLTNRLRDILPFQEVPIRITFRARSRGQAGASVAMNAGRPDETDDVDYDNDDDFGD
jgi:GTP-binding protein